MTSSSSTDETALPAPLKSFCASTDFSQAALQTRMTTQLLHPNGANHQQVPPKLAIAIAGGGGHLASTLAATPGASASLLEASLLYDRESYRSYVLEQPQFKASDTATDTSTDTTSSIRERVNAESFRYASMESAELAGQAALRRALLLSARADPTYGHAPLSNLTLATGVGTASALTTSSTTSKRRRTSRAYAWVGTAAGTSVSLTARMADTQESQRTRFDEDVFVAHCTLTALLIASHETDNNDNNEPATAPANLPSSWTQRTAAGDEISVTIHARPPATTREVILQAAKQILSNQSTCVTLLPTHNQTSYCTLPETILPPKSLIFPGSFNPPHAGHLELATASREAVHASAVFFEVSLTNADKPALAAEAVADRLQAFLQLAKEHSTLHTWGILLTDAPLFVQKVPLLHPRLVSSGRERSGKDQNLDFVIGTDTLVRLLNPKYYDDSREKMLEALTALPGRFVVGGRLEQIKNGATDKEPEFVTGQEQVAGLPVELQDKFVLLPDFRVDLSSSELRQRKQQQQQQQENGTS